MSTTSGKMHNFCEITSSKRIFASEYISEGVPFYRSKEIIEKQSGKLDVSTEIFISETRFEEISDKFGAPQEGDLLLTSVGTLGVPYVVQKDERFYFKDGNLTWFRNFSGLDSQYLYYWLRSPIGKAELQKATIGSSQSAYTINLLGGLSISPHEIGEQRQIAQLLRTYDDLVAANQRRIQLLEESARLLYREWFGRLRFPGHEIVPITDGVPEGWEKRTLGHYVTLNYGKGLKATDRIKGDFPVYGSSGIVGYHNKPLINGPAIIVGRKGTVGSIYYSHCPCFPIDTVYFISSEQTSYYLYLALQGFNFISSDAAVPGLNRNYAYSQQLLIPSPEVSNEFEAKIRPVFEQINALINWNEKLKQARDMLLPKLMSGALDVSRITVLKEIEV